MNKKTYTTIIASGSFTPSRSVNNSHFLNSEFYDPTTYDRLDKTTEEVIQKFHEITNIDERRYIDPAHTTSDMAAFAVNDAIKSSKCDIESLDFILFAHNFGDSKSTNHRIDIVPPLSNKVKKHLKIKNHKCFCHDVIAGCPGWTTAMIMADAYIKSGVYKRGVVIGADTTSYHGDPYDRDCMIFADGAGAVIVEAKESEVPVGILSQSSRSDSAEGVEFLSMGESLNKNYKGGDLYIRMKGNKVYLYALANVPTTVKESLDKAKLHLDDVKKVLIHQANEKMNQAILERIFKVYEKKTCDKSVMPMTIGKFGNSSAATVPVLYDLVTKGKMEGHSVNSGDILILASVGAGMNINSIVYKIP